MRKKYIVSVLIPSLLIQLCSCYSMKEISKDEIAELKEEGNLTIYAKDSTIYFFEESNYRISNDSLYGKGYVRYTEDSDFETVFDDSIALVNIEKVQQDELNAVNTTLLIIGGTLLSVLIVVLGVYSFGSWR